MRVLIIGGGGREHALAWKLARSSSVTAVMCAPGNPGTASVAKNFDIQVTDFDQLISLARAERIDLTVVGPELPLCNGIADRFRAEGLRVFGPSRAAARIEGSKAFAKQMMLKGGIPTAASHTFTNIDEAKSYLSGDVSYPLVIKASGLASGKGVVICASETEAHETLERFLVHRLFGEASATIVIEDFLAGEEVSLFCVTDGATVATLPPAQDHKRLGDGDTGPNTGGMGAICPASCMSESLLARVEREILVPTIHQMRMEEAPFTGLLFAGLMLTRSGPRVLEFNARFGDPETQAILPRLAGDLGLLLDFAERGALADLDPVHLAVTPGAAITVVLAAAGYPGMFQRGTPIQGVEAAERETGVTVFHAGTSLVEGRLVATGGRVLGVTATGRDLAEARERAYGAARMIRFEGVHLRTDIGSRAR